MAAVSQQMLAAMTAAAGGGGSVDPSTLTGLIGWWDASVTASLSLTGANVNSWADQSGGGNTMNWTANGKPQYNATGFNTTKPAVITAASPGFSSLQATSFPMGTGNTLTFWYVGQFNFGSSNGAARALSYLGSGASDDQNDVRSWNTRSRASDPNQQTIGRNEASVSPVYAACNNTTDHRVIGTVNSSGVQTLYVDGISTTLATAPGNFTSNGTLSIGRNAASAANFWAGSFAEVGVATGWHDATTIAGLDLYLKNKWGL